MKKTLTFMLAAAIFLSMFAFPANAAAHPFQDVPQGAWYAENVAYVYENGLMYGTSETEFHPHMKMDRAMLVSVLYRMEGRPTVSGSMPFRDVRPAAYYYTAVLWAFQNGIVSGTEPNQFSPSVSITREMMVTIFYRYAIYKGLDTTRICDIGGYTDAGRISAYAKQPFRWAVETALICGNSATTLNPKGTATRAECAAVLQRLGTLDSSTEPPVDAPLLPGNPVSLLGHDTESFLVGSTLYVRIEDYANAFGLDLSLSENKIRLNGRELALSGLCRKEGNFVPVLSLAQALGHGVFVDRDRDSRTYVYPETSTDIPKGVEVPVLMYHAVSDNVWGIPELFVRPSNMEAQLKYLVDNGYDPIFFSDLPNVNQYDKPVILTFDDGYDDNYLELFPLLKKYNVKATIFVITDAIGGNHKVTPEQIAEMSQSGLVSIQSHTASHPYLPGLSENALITEMSRSQLALTRITGIKPDVLCYPYGNYSALVKRVATQYYNYALIMGPGGYETGDDPYVIGRYYVQRSTGLGSFAQMVANAGK